MGKKLKGIAEQLLIVSCIFILFLLIFESRWVVPQWVQPVGRMHPLLLHFPIVLLLLALGMEFFRFKSPYASNEFYRAFLSNFWLVGSFTAAITVIMGLFLAKEDGYAGDVLTSHKWLGIAAFGLSTVLYFGRTTPWYTEKIAQGSSIVIALALLVGGHYGATLTHGERFITEPLTRDETVPLDKALVYDHVIQPILEQKCVSCHNPEKLKGELSLVNEAALLKGGKSGKLFVAGKPELSLLLQRIHLPNDDKKHMPPVGKSPLTDQEKLLLALWIKSNAEFKKKVLDLPAQDSLRMIAAGLFQQEETPENHFDFSAADEETIQKLRNNDRTIAPLSLNSPALSVNLYNKSSYAPERIQELSEVKTQVVSLNLNKLPVKDGDLKAVAKFENLQKLDLNFTDITGKGLAELTGLKQLATLNISGTKITRGELQPQLEKLKSLKSVSVWNTELTPSDVQQLQKTFKNVQFIAGFKDDGTNPIKLNPPQVKNSLMVFSQDILVKLHHPIRGVEIRYTTDGTAPDSIHSALFTNQTVLNKSTKIRAKAFKKGWFGSDEVTFDFYKNTYKPDSIRLLLPLNRVHQAAGANSYFDGILGTFNANSPAWANNWTGVRNNDLAVVSEFKKPISLSSVGLRIMEETETGIFPPELIEVWGGTQPNQLKLIAKLKPTMPTQVRTHTLQTVTCQFKPQQLTHLKIVAKPLQKIPDWHGSKGRTALLLVDELLLN